MTTTDTRPRHDYRLSTGDVVSVVLDHDYWGTAPETTTYRLPDGRVVPAVLVGSPQDRAGTLFRGQCPRCGRDVGVEDDGVTLNEHGHVFTGPCTTFYIHSPAGIRIADSNYNDIGLSVEVCHAQRNEGWAYASRRNDQGCRTVVVSRSPMKVGSTVADWWVTP